MKDECLVVLYEIHSEPSDSEIEPLLRPTPPLFEKFRVGRERQQPSRWNKFMLAAVKVCFCSLGLWGHRAWNNIPRVLLVILCVHHIIHIFKACGGASQCSKSSNHTFTKSEKLVCQITRISVYTLAVASMFSCLVFIGCCVAAKCKELVLLSPSLLRDIGRRDIFMLFLAFLITNVLMTVAVVFFFRADFSALPEPDTIWFCNVFVIAGTFFFLQWESLNVCYIFAACCFALGTFAQDTRRIIREVRSGTLDDVIRIHEDLCTAVFSTVSAYSVWFVVHWLTQGVGVTIFILKFFCDAEFGFETIMENLFYHGFVFYFCLCLFMFPCVCAARITSQRAGIYEEINCTTSYEWNEGHPFKERHNIALFVSYAKERKCGFKIGGITFNTSLAWVSFFFGLFSVLYSVTH